MNDTIPVVNETDALEQAYADGFDRFEGAPTPNDPEEVDLSAFHDTATYANHVLPSLRAAAGFADGGRGTWTQHREVALIRTGDEDDQPAEADLIDSHYLFDALLEAWNEGAYDGLLGNDPTGPESTF